MENNAAQIDLFADVLHGRLPRKEVIKRAAALGLSAPMIATLLAMTKPDPTPSAGDEREGADA